MGSKTKHEYGWRDYLVLGSIGVLAFVATRWVLGDGGAIPGPPAPPVPIVFDESILAEADPRVADVRALRQIVEERYAYLEHRTRIDGLNLDELETEALASLGSPAGEEDYRRAIRRFVAALHDGHSFVAFKESRLPSNRHWPFSATFVQEGVMIDGVHPDVEGILHRGDLVIAVDGVDIETCLAEVAMERYASTDAARRAKALPWLTDWSRVVGIELTLARATGTTEVVRVPCPLRRLEIPTPAALDTSRDARIFEGDVAYFRPGDFSPPEDSAWSEASPEQRDEILKESYLELDETFSELSAARAMILDLRGNPGGTDLLGKALVRHLVRPSYTYYSLSSLHDTGWSEPSPWVATEPLPEHAFLGPLVCLIDSRTFSVADNVAACLRDVHPDITFIGENTGAGTGAPRFFTLPRTEARVWFCTMRVYSPNGRMIEGEGVAPDIESLRSREDVLAGRDSALEEALRFVRERVIDTGQ